jgi:hypothetical protein
VSSCFRSFLAALLCASVAGCYVPVPETIYSRCEALGTSGWTARVERHPNEKGKMKRRIAVRGTVTLPSAGYGVSLERGPVERVEPRALQVLVRSRAPSEAAAQAVTPYQVEGIFPYDSQIGAISVRCGDGIIAEIPAIEAEPSA